MGESPADIQTLSFEDALAELDAIVKRLEQGQGKLDESIAAYERGTALRLHCEKKLAEAEATVSRIVQKGDGSLSAAPITLE